MSYPGHLLRESYSSSEKQLVYSTTPANWASWLVGWFYGMSTLVELFCWNWTFFFNYIVSSKYSYLIVIIIICLHTVIWFQIFLSYTNNFQKSILTCYIPSRWTLMGMSYSSEICWTLLWGSYFCWLNSYHEQWVPSSCCRRVLYFVNVIKISILDQTSVLVIFHSVTFVRLQQNHR